MFTKNLKLIIKNLAYWLFMCDSNLSSFMTDYTLFLAITRALDISFIA